jgi:hypothetical protein
MHSFERHTALSCWPSAVRAFLCGFSVSLAYTRMGHRVIGIPKTTSVFRAALRNSVIAIAAMPLAACFFSLSNLRLCSKLLPGHRLSRLFVDNEVCWRGMFVWPGRAIAPSFTAAACKSYVDVFLHRYHASSAIINQQRLSCALFLSFCVCWHCDCYVSSSLSWRLATRLCYDSCLQSQPHSCGRLSVSTVNYFGLHGVLDFTRVLFGLRLELHGGCISRLFRCTPRFASSSINVDSHTASSHSSTTPSYLHHRITERSIPSTS